MQADELRLKVQDLAERISAIRGVVDVASSLADEMIDAVQSAREESGEQDFYLPVARGKAEAISQAVALLTYFPSFRHSVEGARILADQVADNLGRAAKAAEVAARKPEPATAGA